MYSAAREKSPRNSNKKWSQNELQVRKKQGQHAVSAGIEREEGMRWAQFVKLPHRTWRTCERASQKLQIALLLCFPAANCKHTDSLIEC